MTLKEAFREHLGAGQQGQLVIKFSGEVHLCKILVEAGQAVHIAHGRMSPEDLLATIAKKTVEWVNFIAGYPVRKKLDFPLHENLLAAVSQQAEPLPQPAAAEPAAVSEPAAVAPEVAAGPALDPERIAALIDGFIDRVGPLGTILAEQAAATINYISDSPMPQNDYGVFLQTLAAEVPETERDAFIAEYRL